jgi:serine/threonine protein kinase
MVDWSAFPSHIIPRLKEHSAMRSIRRQPKIFTETTDFTRIDYGDIINVDARYFLVVGYTKEGRFGIEEQVKQWVPKVYDLETGERKILKLVFYETYGLMLGNLEVTCYRSPKKEAQVLELVYGNTSFMQGYTAPDSVGNLVRILDIIKGRRLDKYLNLGVESHLDYFEQKVPEVVAKFLGLVEAIAYLHEQGFKHGDIRRDHIFVEYDTGQFRWIDFDYDFHLPERPFALDILGLGSVLLYILGRKVFRPTDVLQMPEMGKKVVDSLNTDDLSLVSQDRIFNLRKLYPYIPKEINDILLHFSAGTSVIYDSVREFYEDLAEGMKHF